MGIVDPTGSIDPSGGSDPIKIRKALIADAEALLPLNEQLGYPAELPELRQRLERLIGDPKHFILIAERNGIPIGWLHVEHRLSLEGGAKCEIDGIVVDEAQRGKGIGSRLVAAAIEWASDHQLPLVARSNVKREEAHGFYTALGFDRQKSQHVYVKRP